jgi:hypothetical protein
MLDDDQLTDLLLDSNLIDRHQLEQALEDKPDDQSLYRALVGGDLVDEQPLVELLSNLLNVEYIDVGELMPDAEVLNLLSRDLARDYETLPLKLERESGSATLVVAMTDPIDMMAMDEVASHTGIDIRPVLAGPKSLHAAIDRCYNSASPPDSDEIDSSSAPPAEDSPGSIEDVDPTARRPAPPPDNSTDDVGASVPGRPVTGSSQDEQSDAVELEEAGDTDDADNPQLPDEQQPTRSELGRIAVERVAVSRDDLDEDGNLRPDALGEDDSAGDTDPADPAALTDSERRERLENLVQRLDERSDTLLADDDSGAPADGDPAVADAHADATAPDSDPDSPDQLGLRLAELSPETTAPGIRDALASLPDRDVLQAAIAALVDKGVLTPEDILAHSSRSAETTTDQSSDVSADTDDNPDNTDQGTGPTFSSLDEQAPAQDGLDQPSSEVG